MPIDFQTEGVIFKLKDQKRLRHWIGFVIHAHGQFPGSITYIFTGDTFLTGLNKKYLRHETLTDIITFSYNSGHLISGDVFISVERVMENAEKFGVSFDQEIQRVMIHGVLHLLGFSDKTPSEIKIMRKKESESLALLLNVSHETK